MNRLRFLFTIMFLSIFTVPVFAATGEVVIDQSAPGSVSVTVNVSDVDGSNMVTVLLDEGLTSEKEFSAKTEEGLMLRTLTVDAGFTYQTVSMLIDGVNVISNQTLSPSEPVSMIPITYDEAVVTQPTTTIQPTTQPVYQEIRQNESLDYTGPISYTGIIVCVISAVLLGFAIKRIKEGEGSNET